MQLNLQSLIDDAKCFESVRQLRWPDGVRCPHCEAKDVTRQGRDETQPERQRYERQACERKFDDLTNTVFAGHHQPLKTWILCSYMMGLNLSNGQIAQELDISESEAHAMTTRLRLGVVERKEQPELADEVECDEVYVVAGHKGRSEAVRKKDEPAVGDD